MDAMVNRQCLSSIGVPVMEIQEDSGQVINIRVVKHRQPLDLHEDP